MRVSQQTNIIDKLRIKDTQSYKEWTTGSLKRFLQQPLTLLQLSSTLITGQTHTNSYQLSSKFELIQS